jgi:hypothetical protein
MKLKILLMLYLILSIECKPTWYMNHIDPSGRQVFQTVSEDTVPTANNPIQTNIKIINIMLTTDYNFQTIMSHMNKVFGLNPDDLFNDVKMKTEMEQLSVVWTDMEFNKRHSIPLYSIIRMEYNKKEDIMKIMTSDTAYITKLNPEIKDNYIHRTLFRLISLEYGSVWLYYQNRVNTRKSTLPNGGLDVKDYEDFFPRVLNILGSPIVRKIFEEDTLEEKLEDLKGLVEFLEGYGIYSEIDIFAKLTSFLGALRLLKNDNIEILYNIINYDEKVFLKIKESPIIAKGYLNLPGQGFYEELKHHPADAYELMEKIIINPPYQKFKIIKHIARLWGNENSAKCEIIFFFAQQI